MWTAVPQNAKLLAPLSIGAEQNCVSATNGINVVLTTSEAQQFALWALNKVAPGTISGRIKLGNDFLNWAWSGCSAIVPRSEFRCSGTHSAGIPRLRPDV